MDSVGVEEGMAKVEGKEQFRDYEQAWENGDKTRTRSRREGVAKLNGVTGTEEPSSRTRGVIVQGKMWRKIVKESKNVIAYGKHIRIMAVLSNLLEVVDYAADDPSELVT